MPEANAPSGSASGSIQGEAPQVDVQKLADKVYRLLLADARLARARRDSPLVPQRGGEA